MSKDKIHYLKTVAVRVKQEKLATKKPRIVTVKAVSKKEKPLGGKTTTTNNTKTSGRFLSGDDAVQFLL